jgi:hypothetical protein
LGVVGEVQVPGEHPLAHGALIGKAVVIGHGWDCTDARRRLSDGQGTVVHAGGTLTSSAVPTGATAAVDGMWPVLDAQER